MQNSPFHAPRLFVAALIERDARIACSPEQANYLLNVLRLGEGDEILVFNGLDGEWRARLADVGKRRCALACYEQTRGQAAGPDIDYLFAPLKHARLDYMVQKATEMGVARLRPVLTRRTIAARVNLERMRANVVEAAEQCGILRIPEVAEPHRLEALLGAWDTSRQLILCDEAAKVASPIAALSELEPGPLALLIGPEGGFEDSERELLKQQPFVVAISLGPRVLRADTAAVAALALVNGVLGDWH
jgi:16S rRNA (uracil1498-N3)-methyltransferase